MIDELKGIVVRLLKAAEQHGALPQSEAEAFLRREFEDLQSTDAAMQEALNTGLLARANARLSVTEQGHEFLNNEASGLSVEPESTDLEMDGQFVDDASSLKRPYDVAKLKVESKPVSVFQALRKIEKDEVRLDPDFQRAFVWDLERQSRLIESVLIRIPLPAFYIDATSPERWEVVDGLQRLTTLFRFCRGTSFQLRGLEFLTELNGKTFHDLPKQYQILIEDDTTLNFFNLQPGTPTKAKFTIFRRVNTGGLSLNAQEIRHALVQGPITGVLRKLARCDEFLRATENAVESVRMTDRELVIRSLAFAEFGHTDYPRLGDLDPFLVEGMEKLNARKPQELEVIGQRFIASLDKVRNIFGRYSFRKFYELGGRRSPFNKALFEVWTVCVVPYPRDVLIGHRDQIVSEFLNLMNSSAEPFMRSITYGTGKPTAVKIRFTAIEDLLRTICR